MRRAKNRRGVMLLLAAIFIVVVLSFLAFVVDLTRIYVQKNELHTAADAASLAGVMEIATSPGAVYDSVNSFSQKNPVFKSSRPALVADVTCQFYDITTDALSNSGACDLTKNAVTVTVRDTAAWSFPVLFPRSDKEVKATSTAFLAFAPGAKCIKPIGIDYSILTKALDPDTTLNPNRDLTAADIQKLADPTFIASLAFTLRFPTGGAGVGPGNFGAIEIPGSKGANSYYDDFVTCNPTVVGPGTIVDLKTGVSSGKTGFAMDDLCKPLTPSSQSLNKNGPTTATCFDGNGNVGMPVKVVFFVHPPTPPGGSDMLTVKMIGLIKLETLSYDVSISGHFVSLNTGGSVGSQPSPIRRPILVR